uniref:DDB1-and CUL4-associated factor 8 n=1 Tax=Melanaphis sacchari TaxID=742174 RepID=A0A2H8TPX2_9HEMI
MHLYCIDINPMKPYEFIVNGDDEYVRMYDKRKISVDPVKQFRREIKNNKTEKKRYSIINETEDSAINGTDNSDDSSDNGAVHVADIGASASINVDSDYDEDDISSFASSSLQYLSYITSAVYSYCGTEILASYSEDDIYLFDANGRSNSVLHNYSGHLNRMTIKGVNFYGPRSDYVISGSDSGYIYIWNKETEAIVQRKHADKSGSVNVLEAHPHIPTLATSGLDKTIKIWEPLNVSQRLKKKNLRK